MAKQNGPNLHRFRFQVYDNNEAVMEWIGWQTNLSASILKLIEKSIMEDGYRDITAHTLDELNKSPRRGRPPKSFAHSNELEQLKTSDEENGKIQEALAILIRKGVLNIPGTEISTNDDGDDTVEVPDVLASYSQFAGETETPAPKQNANQKPVKKQEQKSAPVDLNNYF